MMKPNIGMIQQSLNDFDIDLENSWLIGDKISDIQTAINAKISNSILISNEKKHLEFTNIANNLSDNLYSKFPKTLLTICVPL